MSPYDQFEKDLRELMRQGCNLNEAFEQAKRKHTRLADSSAALLKIKQRIEREMRS